MEHKLPWRFIFYEGYFELYNISDDLPIAKVFGDGKDAAFIILAANHFDALREALEYCAEQLAHCLGNENKAVEQARRVLAESEKDN